MTPQAPENHTLQNETVTSQPDETAAFSQHTTHPAATDLQERSAEAVKTAGRTRKYEAAERSERMVKPASRVNYGREDY